MKVSLTSPFLLATVFLWSGVSAFQQPNPFSLRRAPLVVSTSSLRRPTRSYASVQQKDDQDKRSSASSSLKQDPTTAELFANKPQILGKAIPYQDLTIGVLKETYEGENRVSQTPDSVRSLTKAGFHVIVEQGGTMYDVNPI